ncbi:hypothetical protein RRG08_021089 [Elysia crispata]|uniref:Uncharacterized protein n=1 Tax=Elysia crispata TaxID=231223 RepID=A0AAE1E0Y9_9GAST|nr:hypothetical protein RRG08_021089 [Elysia crispata]
MAVCGRQCATAGLSHFSITSVARLGNQRARPTDWLSSERVFCGYYRPQYRLPLTCAKRRICALNYKHISPVLSAIRASSSCEQCPPLEENRRDTR